MPGGFAGCFARRVFLQELTELSVDLEGWRLLLGGSLGEG
jgi:hypothetical protein